MSDPYNDIDKLREAVWKVARDRAAQLPGPEVVEALKAAGEALYESGLDEALRLTEGQMEDWDNIVASWDLVWLSPWVLEMDKRAKGKKAGAELKTSFGNVKLEHAWDCRMCVEGYTLTDHDCQCPHCLLAARGET